MDSFTPAAAQVGKHILLMERELPVPVRKMKFPRVQHGREDWEMTRLPISRRGGEVELCRALQ